MAVIKTNLDEEIIVDDLKYYELRKHTWFINEDGYATTSIDDKLVIMHRMLMNAVPGELIDHKNRNRIDNRILNLRKSNETLNNHNKTKKANTTSKYFGVWSENPGIYRAKISHNRNIYYLGSSFRSEEDAAKAYDRKAIELYGEYANLNFPELV